MTLKELFKTIENALFEPASPLPLCLFRIVYGLVLLEYCFLLAPELITCFSDINGILRIQTLSNVFSLPVINLLTVLPPGDNWIIAFFIVFVIACICVTIGLFSKVSMILVYLGLVSFQHRNIYVMHSGDHLLALAAFYMLFAPIDSALSLDRIRRIWFSSQMPAEIPEKQSLWAFKAYQFQFALIYFQTSWAKLSAPIWWNGTAMYYVLRYEEFARFYVPFVPYNMILIKLSTWAALCIEFCAWIFIWFKETRYYVLGSLVLLHIGIDYAMNIPVFEHIMLASLIIFIPAEDLTTAMNKIKSYARSVLGQPIVLTYNGSVLVQKKLARTVRSLDIFDLVRVVNIQEGDSEFSDSIPLESKSQVMVYASNLWLHGIDAGKTLASKLPLLWISYPFLLLLS
ncbi:MAG: HTTM domain-containing protein [Candidatus Obscuribacterales bacterium]|nr:HTTM domain-containing protein [Candidatus Obscuribacterales bacterium]